MLNEHNCLKAGYPVYYLGYGPDIRQFDTQYFLTVLLQDNLALVVLNGRSCLEAGYPVYYLGYGLLYCYRITWLWLY